MTFQQKQCHQGIGRHSMRLEDSTLWPSSLNEGKGKLLYQLIEGLMSNSIVNVHLFLRQQLRKQNSVYVVLPIVTLWVRSIAWILRIPS